MPPSDEEAPDELWPPPLTSALPQYAASDSLPSLVSLDVVETHLGRRVQTVFPCKAHRHTQIILIFDIQHRRGCLSGIGRPSRNRRGVLWVLGENDVPLEGGFELV